MNDLAAMAPVLIFALLARLLPILLAAWALVLLTRLNAGQQAVIDRLSAIERLLQRPQP
jgi:hypothetical protein